MTEGTNNVAGEELRAFIERREQDTVLDMYLQALGMML